MEASGVGSGANKKKRRRWKKNHWTREEDELLTELVKKHGPWNWGYISDHINGRTGMSCRLRWVNHLNPRIDKKPFSKEEQERLLELHQEIGNKWSAIASFFPGRTDNQLKNQYHTLMAKRNIKASSPSSSTSHQVCLNEGSTDLSCDVSLLSILVAPQFSNVCVPSLMSMPDQTKMPLLSSGSSGRDDTRFVACSSNLSRNASTHSICGRDSAHHFLNNSFASINHGLVYANVGGSHGDLMISDARSAGSYVRGPVPQPPEGASLGKIHFIDFLGVGNSE